MTLTPNTPGAYRFRVACPDHDFGCADAHCAAREAFEATIKATFVWCHGSTPELFAVVVAGILTRDEQERLGAALLRNAGKRGYSADPRELTSILGADGSFDDGPETADRFDRVPPRTSGSLPPGAKRCPGNGGRCPIFITAEMDLCHGCTDAAAGAPAPCHPECAAAGIKQGYLHAETDPPPTMTAPPARTYTAGYAIVQRLRRLLGANCSQQDLAAVDRLEHGVATSDDVDRLTVLGILAFGESNWRRLFPEAAPIAPGDIAGGLRELRDRAAAGIAPDVEPERCSCSESLWLRAKLRRVTGALRRAEPYVTLALRQARVDD